MFPHPLLQKVCIVDTLGSRQDLLSAHEEVIAVRVAGVRVRGVGLMSRAVGGGHGVEGSDGEGEFVEDVEVGAVLFEDETA